MITVRFNSIFFSSLH